MKSSPPIQPHREDLVKTVLINLRPAFLLLVALASLVLSGCASSDPENMSSRPWDSPKSWENGLPMGMTEGR
jgi:hypothetical protein